jgi:RNA polymerase sigma-70 factor, ECF subfamily
VPMSPVESIAGDTGPDYETRDELERAFVRLSPEQRAVVVLYYVHDRTMDDVAESLDLSIGTVKSRLHHARRALRAAIEADARPARQEGPAT